MGDNVLETKSITIGEEHAGERLDKALAGCLEDLSRARLQGLIKAKAVTVNGKAAVAARQKVAEGDEITVAIPPAADADPEPEDIPLTIVYEDDHLLVVDKQAGLVVHPGAGNWDGTLVNALLHHCADSLSGIGGVKRPGLVHRLDKDTTGLLVVAKTDDAHNGLSEQFAAHGRDGVLERAYIALVWGHPPRAHGTIDTMMGRHPSSRIKMAVLREEGRHAVTHYTVKDSFATDDNRPLASQIECRLETGRTHQIRVHLAHIGHPVMGDPLYAAGFAASRNKLTPQAVKALEILGRQALHAARLGFVHPATGDKMLFESELPEDMKTLKNSLKTS